MFWLEGSIFLFVTSSVLLAEVMLEVCWGSLFSVNLSVDGKEDDGGEVEVDAKTGDKWEGGEDGAGIGK